MLVGGGTGGHILPLLAVARKLKKDQKNIRIVAVIDKTTRFAHLLESSNDIDRVMRISAGKLRRYPNQGLTETILDIKTTVLNIRDGFRMIAGVFQAIGLLRQQQPDVIFIKGGFVGVPVGIAARLNRVPFVTHDSDASPGLANKIIARWARMHTVGLDKSLYSYPDTKTIQVGIPTAVEFKNVTRELKKAYRKEIGVPASAKLIFVTGGSQGAQSLNDIISCISHSLIAEKDIYVIHQTGRYISPDLPVDNDQYRTVEYLANLYCYSGAADVILSRTGSTMAEFAAQGKAVVGVPAPQLAGGHQVKNAEILQKANAAIVLKESDLKADPKKLLTTLLDLLNDTDKQKELTENLAKVYPPNAADKITEVLIRMAE